MGEVISIGIDLAKNVFQVHGATADGQPAFRKKLSRPQFARFVAEQPPCLVQTMPGVGPITALAVETFAPPMEQFRRGRDVAAWLGLVPRQHSTGRKQKLGKTIEDRAV